jgi:hypothetical protein
MCKNVSFNDTVAYTGIERHQDWTFDERSSVWYTIAEYRSFAIEEHRQKKRSGRSSAIKYESKAQRMHRIGRIRCLVVKAQSIQEEDDITKDKDGKKHDDDDTKWLAEFYHHHF